MSGLRMPRPVAVLPYSGPRNRIRDEYLRIQQERQLGNITPAEFRTIVVGLNQAQRRYEASIVKRADKRNFMKEQAEAFQREYEKEQKRLEKQRLDKQAEIRAQLAIQAVRMEREAKEKAMKERREARKTRVRVESVESFKERITEWLNGEEKDQTMLFELPVDMLQSIKLKDKMTVQFDLMRGGSVVDSYSTTIKNSEITDIHHHYNYSDKVIGLRTNKKTNTRFISDESIADKIMKSDTLRLTVFQPINPRKKPQAFRDGTDHCVFQPIIQYLENAKNEAKTDKTKWNYQTKINKAMKLAVEYDSGVPEEDFETVAHALDIGIVIHSLDQHELYRYNNRNGKNKIFHFINTRMNHLEMLTISMDAEPEMITKEEGVQLIEKCVAERLYNYYEGTITNPRTILTAGKRYVVGDKLSNTLFEFTKSFDRGCMIDYIKEKELGDFLLSGVNLMINFKNRKCRGSPVSEIDMKKAYTQYKRCSVYQGFPAVINNVRDCAVGHDVVTHSGVYQVLMKKMVKTCMNAKKIDLAKAYGFTEGSYYVLSSPWIVKLREIGCEVEVLYGAWGKRMEFDFSQEMISEKLYAPWTGMNMRRDTDLHYKMACDMDFAEVVMAQHEEENIEYNQATQTIMINKKKDHHYIMPHVSAFLVAYTQIQVFDEASKYNVSEIVAHKLDSIVLTREPLPFDSTLWEDSTSDGIAMSDYTSNYIFKNSYVELSRGKITSYLGDCFISGQGGSGKTHTVMSDTGFRGKLFVSTSWELVADKMAEYKCRGGSVNQLLGFDIYGKKIQSQRDKFGQPGTITYDEVSMTNTELVKKIQEMYPYSQLILMGDYDKGKYYQSSVLMEGKQLYHPVSYHMITDDYRSIDEETRQFKKHIRELMDRDESLVSYLYSTIPSVTDIRSEYSMDYIMTGTHARIKHFTSMLQSDKNWYKVTKHHFDDVAKKCAGQKGVWLHGEILDFPIEGRTELTHAFTVHSFQGKTIPVEKKCFVDLSYLKCNQDIYTAVSRVRSIHQLRLIPSDFSSVMFSNGMYHYN